MIYGYARVSTDGQSVDAQVKQLRAAGAEKVFREVETDPAPDARGHQATRWEGGASARDCPDLQCLA
jgi:DNA invertase Pin-like site-specific DNA recombinase